MTASVREPPWPSTPRNSYEYGIARRNDLNDLHRSGMTESEAETWMVEWVQMAGRRAPFKLVRRPVGDWEIAE